jgi:hypothetical protein
MAVWVDSNWTRLNGREIIEASAVAGSLIETSMSASILQEIEVRIGTLLASYMSQVEDAVRYCLEL